MSNGPESSMMRARTSDIDLTKMMSDPERVMRDPTNPSIFTTFCWQEQKVHEQIDTLKKR